MCGSVAWSSRSSSRTCLVGPGDPADLSGLLLGRVVLLQPWCVLHNCSSLHEACLSKASNGVLRSPHLSGCLLWPPSLSASFIFVQFFRFSSAPTTAAAVAALLHTGNTVLWCCYGS